MRWSLLRHRYTHPWRSSPPHALTSSSRQRCVCKRCTKAFDSATHTQTPHIVCTMHFINKMHITWCVHLHFTIVCNVIGHSHRSFFVFVSFLVRHTTIVMRFDDVLALHCNIQTLFVLCVLRRLFSSHWLCMCIKLYRNGICLTCVTASLANWPYKYNPIIYIFFHLYTNNHVAGMPMIGCIMHIIDRPADRIYLLQIQRRCAKEWSHIKQHIRSFHWMNEVHGACIWLWVGDRQHTVWSFFVSLQKLFLFQFHFSTNTAVV